MSLTVDEVYTIKKARERDFQTDHHDMRYLRHIYEGRFWDNPERAITEDVAENLRDLRHQQTSEREPELKFVANYLFTVVNKYQNLILATPQISVPTPPGSDKNIEKRQAHADYVEQALYAAWNMSNMQELMTDIGWYLPTMGSALVGVVPDFDKKMAKFVVRSPEYAYPAGKLGSSYSLDSILFCWKERQSAIKKQFPNYEKAINEETGKILHSVDYLEHWTETERIVVAGGQRLAAVKHDLGYVPWRIAKFHPIPRKVFGESAIGQLVSMNQNLNLLTSLEAEYIMENLWPRIVLVDPQKAPEYLDKGRGAIWPVNAGGDVKVLTTNIGAGSISQPYARNLQILQDATEMGPAMFGQSQGSIITGKAITQQQAPTRSAVEKVQINLGSDLAVCNEWWLDMQERFFGDEDVRAYGYKTEGMLDTRGKKFGIKIQGKKFRGYRQNQVIFSPAMNPHEKAVIALQLQGGGVVSKRWTRDQMGIPDSESMEQEIFNEHMQDAVKEQVLAAAQQGNLPLPVGAGPPGETLPPGGTPEAFRAAREGAMGPGEGKPGPRGGPPPINVPSAPQGGPPGIPPPAKPPIPMGAAPAGPKMEAPEVPPSVEDIVADEEITFDEAFSLLPTATKVRGRIFLVGEVLPPPDGKGTTDKIELAITDGLDKKTILDQFPPLYGMIQFHKIKDTPNEPYMEVTPNHVGNQIEGRGEAPAIPSGLGEGGMLGG